MAQHSRRMRWTGDKLTLTERLCSWAGARPAAGPRLARPVLTVPGNGARKELLTVPGNNARKEL